MKSTFSRIWRERSQHVSALPPRLRRRGKRLIFQHRSLSCESARLDGAAVMMMSNKYLLAAVLAAAALAMYASVFIKMAGE